MARRSGSFIRHTWDDKKMRVALNKSQKGVRPVATAAFHSIGKATVSQMRKKLVKQGKVDTGNLRDQIDYEVLSRRGLQTLRIGPRAKGAGAAPYDLVIDKGRRPGGKMPPQGVLLPWMQRHGIPEKAEFPIRRKIAEEGLQGQPFPYISEGFEAASPATNAIMGQMLGQIERLIS